MKKSEFLRILKDSLMGMNQNDKREIMLDYEEHFIDGVSEGRTEEEICDALGDPKQIALNLKRNMEFNNPTPSNDGVNTAGYVVGIIALSIGVLWLFSVLIGLVLGGISLIYAIIAASTIFTGSAILMTVIGASVFAICILALITLGLIKLIPHVLRWYKTMINGLTPDESKHIKREFKGIRISPVIWILVVVILFISLGFTIVGGVITARDIATNTDIDELVENADELAEKVEKWAIYHEWVFDDYDEYHDFKEWIEYREERFDDIDEFMDEFEEEIDELEDDIDDITK